MLKKYFIPHRGNNHQPHILRRQTVTAALVLLLLIEAVFLVQILVIWPLTGIFSSILPGVLVDLTNSSRAQNNIPSLKVNPLLEQAAQLKAEDMAAKSYFAHTSPEGVEPWYWLAKVNYNYSGAGENLAINFSDSNDIANAWMNSPGHRANILDNRFSEIGIATAKGLYQGKETIFVVQYFGRPQVLAQKVLTPSKSPLPSPQNSPAAKISAVPSAPGKLSPSIVITQGNSNVTTSVAVVAGAAKSETQIKASVSSSFWQKFISMPKTMTSAIYIAIAAIFLIALALKIFVKIRIQYPKLIFNGIIVLFVVITLLYFNFLIVGQGLQSQIFVFNIN